MNNTNNWILYDDKAHNFFIYCVENLSEKNILTESELRYIGNVNTAISSTELNEAIQEIELKYPGLFSINQNDCEELEKYATLIEEENSERFNRINEMEEYVRKEEYLMHSEELMPSQNVSMIQNQISEKIKNLETMRKSNAHQITLATRRLQTDINFLFQIPNDQSINLINRICHRTDNFMRKNFNVKGNFLTPPAVADPMEELTNEKNKILKLQQAYLDNEINLAGVEYAMEQIDEKVKILSNQPSSERKCFINDFIYEEENLQLEYETMLDELHHLYIQQPIFKKVFNDFCIMKRNNNV